VRIYKLSELGRGWNYNKNKSNNATRAESLGRFPATIIEEKLKKEGIYTHKSFILEVYYEELRKSKKEWHHIGHMYRKVMYFDYDAFKQWFLSSEGQQKWKEWKEKRQNYQKITIDNCSIKWLEFPEFTSKPGKDGWQNLKPTWREEENVTIIDASPKSVDIVFPNGEKKKKLKSTKGFKIKTPLSTDFEYPQMAIDRYNEISE